MLESIRKFENENLHSQISSIGQRALADTLQAVEADPDRFRRDSFASALDGIRKGKMDFELDPVLPIFKEKVAEKSAEYKSLTAEDEARLLSLSGQQREIVATGDKIQKEAYITAAPQVSSASLRVHPKF